MLKAIVRSRVTTADLVGLSLAEARVICALTGGSRGHVTHNLYRELVDALQGGDGHLPDAVHDYLAVRDIDTSTILDLWNDAEERE